MIKLMRKSNDEENETPRSRLLFYGPKDDDLLLEEQIYRYYDNDKQFQSNCTTDRMLYAFLLGMFYNGEKLEFDDPEYSNSSNIVVKRSKNFTILKTTEDRTAIIKCVYRTPNVSITSIDQFVREDLID
uniref:Pkinase_fungal domain-containing protein n=1 Tax=Strongyloides papillosus TaxID=174720 RepID=A0A0N5BZC0_STREA